MTKPRYKKVSFRLPIPMYEALFRIFPMQGEMTLFFKTMSQKAIDLGSEATIHNQIRQQCEGDKDGQLDSCTRTGSI
jgi:hypothetical protein